KSACSCEKLKKLEHANIILRDIAHIFEQIGKRNREKQRQKQYSQKGKNNSSAHTQQNNQRKLKRTTFIAKHSFHTACYLFRNFAKNIIIRGKDWRYRSW